LPDSVLLDRLPDDALRSASRLMESVSLELMIPASAHQAALRGGAPIELVAVGPFWQQEDDVERLIAFDRWGHRIWLDPTIPPDAVTLVLSASEKTSASDCEGSELYHAVPAMTPEGVSLDAHGDRMMYIWLTQMRVFDDMEPWWKGEPELYMLYGRDRETAHRFDLSAKQNAAHDLNHEDLWYCIDAPLCAWYGEKDDEAIGFWIMEADWGREVSADLCTGSDGQWLDTCASAVIGDLDDSLGSASVEMGDLREGTVSACDGERWARYTIPFKLTGAAEFCLADRPMGAQEGAE